MDSFSEENTDMPFVLSYTKGIPWTLMIAVDSIKHREWEERQIGTALSAF